MGQVVRNIGNITTDTVLTVAWEKTRDGNWYTFEPQNIDCVSGSGVCIVWHEGETPATVCVGHGDLAQCLHEFYENRAVSMYRKLGPMRFTWTEMSTVLQRGVSRYLSEQLKPAFEDTATLVKSIPVNLPA
jgi:hypothetical protein